MFYIAPTRIYSKRSPPTCPLEVDAVGRVDGEPVWDEVILHGGVRLDDVSPLPPHVDVVDTLGAGTRLGPDHGAWAEHHDMGPVLEGAAKLGGVDGEPQWLVGGGANVHVRVLLHGRATPHTTKQTHKQTQAN